MISCFRVCHDFLPECFTWSLSVWESAPFQKRFGARTCEAKLLFKMWMTDNVRRKSNIPHVWVGDYFWRKEGHQFHPQLCLVSPWMKHQEEKTSEVIVVIEVIVVVITHCVLYPSEIESEEANMSTSCNPDSSPIVVVVVCWSYTRHFKSHHYSSW